MANNKWEEKAMQLTLHGSIESQQKLAATLNANIVKRYFPLENITVSDFPVIKREDGTEEYPVSLTIAIENLRDKYNLHGEYSIEQLLTIENQNKTTN